MMTMKSIAFTISKSLAVALVSVSLANAGEVVEISIEKMKFEPQQVKIKPGTTVKWVNNERRNNHSVFFEKEGYPESERFFPGESWQRTFDNPGTYPYRCGPHPEMTGVVEVGE
ncbi:plastocyanin precursor [Sulfuricella denitrificans skB26]|uniref:Plastocyanin n=1 Tax=Sulfuricella denitrificans (strain DSM 22764 / NBRC 105220 / skB26) TaxID=1163617 RepID=S6AI78_SULDS|nr:plastocyanin/azurin family copper-binding protein [Sulfuricella denitrificans]BAN34219.1 plastocyanin precursor [Sulfuricella denitrificans skB26]